MRRKLIVLLGIVSTAAVLLVGCAPRAAPVPPPAATPAPVPAAPASNLPTPTAQEIAWAKVVSEARKEGKVTMYSWGYTSDVGKEAVAGFEKAYGIRIEIVGGVGAVLLERLKTERAAAKFIADTYDTATPFVLQARAAGLIAPIDFLPELNRQVKWRAKPNEPDIFPYYVSVGAPYVNTTLVKAGQEPKSYKDLLQPQWKGKIVLAPSAIDPTSLYPYVAGKKYGSNLPDDAYYRQLGKQDLKLVASVREVAAALSRGEASIAFQSSAGMMNSFILEGAPIKPVAMEEGQVMQWGASIAAVKDGPHPNATKLLINWLLSAEGQAAANRARGALPIRDDVPDFAPAAARLEIKKSLVLEIPDQTEMSRLQRERVMDKIMGIEP